MGLAKFLPSGLSRESRPWGRQIEDRIQAAERALSRSESDGTNANKGQNSTMRQLSDQIRAMPVPISGYKILNGFAPGSVTYIDVPLTVPAGKTKVTVTAIANIYLTANSRLGTIDAYIEANGTGFIWSTAQIPGMDSASLAGFGLSINGALGFAQETSDPFTITLSIYPNNPAYFPAISFNFASLTVNAIFYD